MALSTALTPSTRAGAASRTRARDRRLAVERLAGIVLVLLIDVLGVLVLTGVLAGTSVSPTRGYPGGSPAPMVAPVPRTVLDGPTGGSEPVATPAPEAAPERPAGS